MISRLSILRWGSLAALALLLSLASTAQTPEQKIERYVQQAIKDWNIPGCAIAIVKDGETVMSKGFGVADVRTGAPVTEHTLFAIASNTKAYTTAALATLVDDGRLDWDDKVVDHLPYFKMYDDYVTQQMTIADLVCHRSGLATFSGDLLWYGTDYSREEVIKKASQLEPVMPFRTGYGYQNIMYMAAGEVIEEVTGMAWDDYVSEQFLRPLGMKETYSSVRQLKEAKDISAPHNDVKGENVAIDWLNWDNIGPAGSLISSAHDATKWMKLQIGKGTLDGKTYWSEERSNEMWTIHTPKPLSGFHRRNFPSKHFSGYGLGWDLYDYEGRSVANHGGGYDGFISHTVLVPEEGLGAIILTNNITSFAYAMQYVILDAYLAPDEDRDFGQVLLNYKRMDDKEAAKREETILASRLKDAPASLPLSAYAGQYECTMYGGLTISENSDGLQFQFDRTPLFTGRIEHFHHNTFRLHWGKQSMLPTGMMNFILNADGTIREVEVVCENPDFDFSELEFMRKD